MEELEEMFAEAQVNSNGSNKLYTNAEVDVQITKESDELIKELEELEEVISEERELTVEDLAKACKKEAMNKLGEYESLEDRKVVLAGELKAAQQELEMQFSKVRAQNLELLDRIEKLGNDLEDVEKGQAKLKEDLLPIQKELYKLDSDEKTLVYNKIQSTFVAATEKNQFDLKKFREEQADFWKTNLEVLKPYAKITDVAAYLKITVKK